MNYTINLTGNKKSNDGSILAKVYDFSAEMSQHEKNHLNVYKKNPQLSSCDREVTYFDRHTQNEQLLLMFGSNSYLGVTNLSHIKEVAVHATIEMGIGSGGVPLLTGTTIYQDKLEKKIAEYTGFDDTILFSSGFTANLGVLSGLIRPDNLIIHDKLNHASLLDGTILSGAKMLRYKHNDMSDLNRILKDNHEKFKNKILIVTDGVFSMDGDIAKIPEIIKLARKYDTLLLIDDAHATGVIGSKGKGTLSHFGIEDNKNIIVTGTLSKAIGTLGGYITADQPIIDYLRIYARSNMFSTSLPPSICAAAIEVFNTMANTDIVDRLNKNSWYARTRLKEEGFNILNTETAIIPLIIGDQTLLTKMTKDFIDSGILINPIFPPAVPANLVRFRISIMASHIISDINYLIDTIIKIFNQYGIQRYVS